MNGRFWTGDGLKTPCNNRRRASRRNFLPPSKQKSSRAIIDAKSARLSRPVRLSRIIRSRQALHLATSHSALATSLVTATLAQTESLVSDRKQTTGPLCDRNTLPYFYFRSSFASYTRPAYFLVLFTSHESPVVHRGISNRNQGILEIGLT